MNVAPFTIGLALLLPSLGHGQTGSHRGPTPTVAQVAAVKADTREPELGRELQQSLVWLDSAPTGTQVYAVLRKQWEWDEAPKHATLHLFADSRYLLWINGQYVDRGPCRFDPIAPEYDSLDVRPYLKPGTNAIAVLVHHYHDGKTSTDWDSINGRIMRHAPGLTARLEFYRAETEATDREALNLIRNKWAAMAKSERTRFIA